MSPKSKLAKRFYIFLPIIIISFLYVSALYADEFVLKGGAGMLVTSKADSLWGDGKKNIDSIYEKPEARTKIYPFPIFEATYIHSNWNIEYYLLASASEPGSVQLGAEKKFDKNSSIDFYSFYSLISKGWENPYVLNRESTDAKEYGGRITYENILNTNFSLSYKVTFTDVKNDVIGDLYSDLRRDGITHVIEVSHPLTSSIAPGFSYEKGAMKGESNSYDSYGFFLDFNYNAKDLNLNSRLSAKNARFDKVHPIFQKTRDENTYEATATAEILNPLGFKNYFITVGAIAERTESNIQFFAKKESSGFISIGYSFK